jgi:hypothetical protein
MQVDSQRVTMIPGELCELMTGDGLDLAAADNNAEAVEEMPVG